jgi:large subunit ribosomal protein L13
VDTLSYKTKSAKPHEVKRQWFIVDAEGEVLGRMATRIAEVLRGKHKPSYTPHVDCGDFVIVVNAEKVRLTGNKLDAKIYDRYSGYPGGRKEATAREILNKKPEMIVENAVKGMLPKNKLGRQMYTKLFVYTGAEHPHMAQKPETLKIG